MACQTGGFMHRFFYTDQMCSINHDVVTFAPGNKIAFSILDFADQLGDLHLYNPEPTQEEETHHPLWMFLTRLRTTWLLVLRAMVTNRVRLWW